MSITFEAEIGSDQVIRPPEGVVLPAGKLRVTVQAIKPNGNMPTRSPAEILAEIAKLSKHKGQQQTEKTKDQTPGVALTPTQQMLFSFAKEMEELNPDLPSDLAAQHDHYLYGTPKQ